MPRRIVIIGHGPAGMTAAGYASLIDREAKITVLNSGEQDIYHPCSLPFAIGGNLDISNVVEDAKYRKVKLLNGTTVDSIDTDGRTVAATGPDGSVSFDYDSLLIATGASPLVQPVDGVDLDGVHVLKTPAHARDIIRSAEGARTAVVVGGSAIGVETASELAGRGIRTTLVEMAPSLLPASLDPDIAGNVSSALEAEGVGILTDSPVERIIGDGRVSGVAAGGREIAADLVVLATGVQPETGLAASIGCAVGGHGGILVDNTMATSVDGVFAAGDCVDTVDLVTEKTAPMRLAGTATRQGRVAGITMAGGKASFPGALGSWVVATHTFHAGGAGLTDARASAEGTDTVSVKLRSHLRPHYISGDRITIKITAMKGTGRILGGQVFGPYGVSETVNYIALAITAGLTAYDLAAMDWCYAPLASECVNPMASAADALIRRMSRGR